MRTDRIEPKPRSRNFLNIERAQRRGTCVRTVLTPGASTAGLCHSNPRGSPGSLCQVSLAGLAGPSSSSSCRPGRGEVALVVVVVVVVTFCMLAF